MISKRRMSIMLLCMLLSVLFIMAGTRLRASEKQSAEADKKPALSLSDDMGKSMIREAVKVKDDLEKQAQSLFERTPLGWDLDSVNYLFERIVFLPREMPKLFRHLREQGRKLGAVGSVMILIFIAVLLYSLIGQKQVVSWINTSVRGVEKHMPERFRPYIQSGIHVVASGILPLVLLGFFSLINAMTAYEAAWFKLTGRLLGLWAAGAVLFHFLKVSLTGDLIAKVSGHGETLFLWTKLALFYVLIIFAAFWAVETFRIREDILALFKSVVSVSIFIVLFQLFLHKSVLLSLFPELPYLTYRKFVRYFGIYYYPLVIISFISGLLWCSGYRSFASAVLTKIWFTTGAFLIIILLYHFLNVRLERWSDKPDHSDETARFLFRSLKSLLMYATLVASTATLLNFLGFLNPMQRIMSFPIFQVGATPISFWIIIKAILILLGFIFASRLLQAYMDYRVYPSLGVDPGLGYALNTCFKYVWLSIGFLISIKIVGIDLRFLLVFAGAMGIGIGLGLQSIAANIISGFTIIFGGKIRKGDWIEVGGNLGTVTDIYLRATKVRTRDNIEYLVPNSELISNTIVNYSLSSPMIRIDLPVGASYGADPKVVEQILIEAANREPLVSKHREPSVRFIEYADSSINFELLFWIDVRKTPRREVRSALYFTIFNEFKKAGVQIPFPQRDIHIRSTVE